MNKFWKEIERLSNKSEQQINKELAYVYNNALEELKMRIGAFMAEHQNLRYVDLLQLNKLESLYKQVDDASRKVIDAVKAGTYKADLRELELGYFGEFYTIESQLKNLNMDSNLSFGLMSEEYIKQVIEFPVNGIPISKRLYGDTLPSMQRSIKATITEGLIQGYSYKEIARNLSESMDNSYRKSKTIVRSESGRIRSMARQESIDKAKELGVDLKKEWISTLDLKTRHSHASMDGQVVGTDEEFTSPRGYRAMQPRMFGVAAEDINCRCGCTSVVNGIRAKGRRDNIYKTIDNYGTYEEWLKKKHTKEYEDFKKISDDIYENSGIILPDINIGKSLGAASFNYHVKLPNGKTARLAEGTKITKVVAFAGKGTNKPVKMAKYLSKQYNVPETEWEKVRGDGYVDEQGIIKHAELHWFESDETGRIKMKVKRYFDEG
jgi:SPP1 gp7 family putative phage head morphogenesis protein